MSDRHSKLSVCAALVVLVACGAPMSGDPDASTDAGMEQPDAGPLEPDAGVDAGEENRAPDAVDDAIEVPPTVATEIDVLANDVDPDSDPLAIASVGEAEHGTVTFDGERVRYQPAALFEGEDAFTYTVADGRGGMDAATVHVTVTPAPNNAPRAEDDAAETTSGLAVTIDVLANDLDPDGDALTITGVTAPASGSASSDSAEVVYTPAAGFAGIDTFDYEIADPQGEIATATVTVTVFGLPDAVDDAAVTVARAPVRVEVLDNDTHPNGLALMLDSIGAPMHGAASIDGDAVVYTADLGFVGTDELTYTARDARGETDTATITIEVQPAALGVDIAAGGNQSFAIGPDGSLSGWGSDNNVFGRATPAPIGSATNWVGVEAGQNHACAIDADGYLYCWNDNFNGQLGLGDVGDQRLPTRVGSEAGWTVVSAGGSHTCGIRGGDLYCWGRGAEGQIGNGSYAFELDTPQLVAGDGRPWTHIAAGGYHTCAIRGGELWCWGGGGDARGDPDLPFRVVTPVHIGTDTDWARVVAGDNHSCGLKLDGSLWCWGHGPATGLDRRSGTPARVGSSTAWTDLSADRWNTCGIDGGVLRCWGYNDWGQIGDGTQLERPTPTTVGAGTDWVRVAVGAEHACAAQSDGSLWCWGRRRNGQLGDGLLIGSLVPLRIDGSWQSVGAGGDVFRNGFGCGVRGDGTLWWWGAMDRTPLGPTIPSASPAQVGADTTWVSVEAGHQHACGLRSDDSLWCWGVNDAGELGQGTSASSAVPLRVGGTATYRQVTGGADHTCAIASDGALYCWGSNRSGSLGTGAASRVPLRVGTDVDWQSVSAGDDHTCAIRTSGTLWCWGSGYGEAPVQVGADADWQAVSAGESQTCGVRAPGTLWCWANGTMPAQVGTDADWIVVSARGDEHACAIRTDGTLWCFGRNRHGQLGDGTTTTRELPVQVGTETDWVGVVAAGRGNYSAFTCGVRRDGSLWCWGNGDWGQLGQGNAFSTVPVPVASSGT